MENMEDKSATAGSCPIPAAFTVPSLPPSFWGRRVLHPLGKATHRRKPPPPTPSQNCQASIYLPLPLRRHLPFQGPTQH